MRESELPGLTTLELGRLRMSVGYGGRKTGRPYSPVEVGELLQRAREHGASIADCAQAAQLHGTGVSRFLRLLGLPPDLQHLIDWGSGEDFIGFSTAVEAVKLKNADEQRALASAILTHRLNRNEARQATQLRHRSRRPIEECIPDVLRMRPTVVKRYVFIGSVGPEIVEVLRALSQSARNSILEASIERIGLEDAMGRLGDRFFTLVGGERFNRSMRVVGKDDIEELLRKRISQSIANAIVSR